LTSPSETIFRSASGVTSILLFLVFVQSIIGLKRRQNLVSEARSEENLLNEARIRDFAEAAADRFWETDKNHRYTYVSKAPEGSNYLPRGGDWAHPLGGERWQ